MPKELNVPDIYQGNGSVGLPGEAPVVEFISKVIEADCKFEEAWRLLSPRLDEETNSIALIANKCDLSGTSGPVTEFICKSEDEGELVVNLSMVGKLRFLIIDDGIHVVRFGINSVGCTIATQLLTRGESGLVLNGRIDPEVGVGDLTAILDTIKQKSDI